jgi:uncharacterized protein (PEP-CTERM system associated)
MGTTPITNKDSPDNERHKLSFALISTVVTAAVMWPARVQAVEWSITPTVTVRETYSDNVRLAPAAAARSDFISEITPGINVIGNGRGVKAHATYGLQYLSYAHDSEGSTIAHHLDASANVELLENLFFFDGSAAISQQNISAFGAQPVDNTNVTGNRTSVRTLTASPYLRHSFGTTASSEARYTHTSVSTSTGGLADADTDGVLLSLNSGPAFRNLGWGLQHSHQRNHFENAQTIDFRTTSGNLRYLLTPRFALTATGGYDKYDYASTGDQPKGWFYTGGFSWKPSERTSIAASAGKRFWGRTYMLESSLRGRLSLWRVSYNESVTTSQSQFAIQATNNTSGFLNQLFLGSIPDPVARQRAVDRFILTTGITPVLGRPVNYFTNQFFLEKSLQASVAVTGAKNTVILGLFNTSRRAQTALGATEALLSATTQSLDANTRQTGVNATWDWRVTALTSASLNAMYARTRLETTDALQRLKALRGVIAMQIQPKLNGGLELRRQMQTSDLAGGDYTENAISVFLSMRF